MKFFRTPMSCAVALLLALFSAAPAMAYDPDSGPQEETRPHVTASDLKCLAEAVYFEARGESVLGQEAVAQVAMNRARFESFPKSICGVVYQNQHRRNACQFSFACDGKPEIMTERVAWRKAQTIAYNVATGQMQLAVLRTATHYHATYVAPNWAKKMTRLMKIGLHVFYCEDR